jgi:hypothetical protein
MYYDQLVRFYEHFPREQILVLLFDDLISDPMGYLRSIYRFLGVQEDFVSGWETVKVNQATGKGNLARSRVLAEVSRVLMLLKLHGLEKRVRDFNSLELEPMSEDSRRRLDDIYRESNSKLQDLIGVDLGRWNHAG